MEARYIFCKQLEDLDLSRDSIVESLNFHPAESIL